MRRKASGEVTMDVTWIWPLAANALAFVFSWNGLGAALALLLCGPRLLVFVSGRIARMTRVPRLRARAFADTPQARATGLVVVVSGLRDPNGLIRRMATVAREALAGADLLIIRIDGALTSNACPADVAGQVESLIAAQDSRMADAHGAPYPKIVLVGHSTGALLARKAVLFASDGFGADRPGLHGAVAQGDAGWRKRLDRMVLLAGLNGGWVRGCNIWIAAGASLLDITGVGRFVRGLERGTPFVETLRCEWMQLLRAPRGAGAPFVVQLAGSDDWAIVAGNEKDLSAAIGAERNRSFAMQTVDGASHLSILDMTFSADEALKLQARRAARFAAALTLDPEALLSDGATRLVEEPETELAARAAIRSVLLVLDGAREETAWLDAPRVLARTLFPALDDATVARERPPHVSKLSFLFDLWGRREALARWTADKHTRLRAEHPNATLSVLGHGSGAWAVGRLLHDVPVARLGNIVLAGSVLPQSHDWAGVVKAGRVLRLCNIRARSDLWTAVFTAFFQWLSVQVPGAGRLGMFRLGQSGFAGFGWQTGEMGDIASLDGGHNALLESREASEFAVAFCLQDTSRPAVSAATQGLFGRIRDQIAPDQVAAATAVADGDFRPGKPAFAALANRFVWISWGVLALALAGFITVGAFGFWLFTPIGPVTSTLLSVLVVYWILDSL